MSLVMIIINQIINNYIYYKSNLFKLPRDLREKINYKKFKLNYKPLNLPRRYSETNPKPKSENNLDMARFIKLYKYCYNFPLCSKIHYSYHIGYFDIHNPNSGRVYNTDYFFISNKNQLNYQIICLSEFFSGVKSIIKNKIIILNNISKILANNIDPDIIYNWYIQINNNPYLENKIKIIW